MNWFFSSRRGIAVFVLILLTWNGLFLYFDKELLRPQPWAPSGISAALRFGFSPSGMFISAIITLAIWVTYLSRLRNRLGEQTQVYLFGIGLAALGSIVLRVMFWPR